MQKPASPLQLLSGLLKADPATALRVASEAAARRNDNASRNAYLTLVQPQVSSHTAAPLFGIPISLKDCFDVAGLPTSCGARFYLEHDTPATSDSWMMQQIRRSGATLMGKTHLHQLAYGITGESRDFGDCLQPEDPTRLTGGSSSGAAASVQQGSALVAIGTDTGGSIRVPAALCGLAGYRSTVGVGSWLGAGHLAPTFDTLGLLFRDLRDGPALAAALLGIRPPERWSRTPHIAFVDGALLQDADSVVRTGHAAAREQLLRAGATLQPIAPTFWHDALEIFAAIQAHEAAALQRQHLASRADFTVFEPAIADRLAWGESLRADTVAALRLRHAAFRSQMDALLTGYDFLALPCAPLHQLPAGADHSQTRQRILRYTTPISLAGMPAVTVPQSNGAGLQLVAPRGRDSELLAFAAQLEALP
ncbi:MAG: amidase [Acidobacteriota bacterium]|nr:amidase [Acidobacteriota bacterium]